MSTPTSQRSLVPAGLPSSSPVAEPPPTSLSDNDNPAGSSSCGSAAAPAEWNVPTPQTGKQSAAAASSARARAALLMHIRTQTWLADSHGLFDYESRSILSNEFKCTCLSESYHVCRIGSEIRFLPEDEAVPLYESEAQAKPLLQVTWANGSYNLMPPPALPAADESTPKEEPLWLVVRHLHDRSVVVTQGDLLKLGRFNLRVKETVVSSNDAKNSLRFLCHDDDDCETVAPEPGDSAVELDGFEQLDQVSTDTQQPQQLVENAPPAEKQLVSSNTTGPRICRICLCEADESDHVGFNPLVAPCECKGSMRWVHLQCLRTWMAGRLNIRNDGNMVSFFWRTLECELCRLAYPSVVRVRESGTSSDEEEEDDHRPDSAAALRKKSGAGWKTLDLFEIPRLEVPYAILEPRSQQNRGLHIVSLANNKAARLGRGHESDIRLADISVSRLHSLLRFQPPPVAKRIASASIVGSGGVGYGANDVRNGCFIIEDNRSKFGTLLELRKPFRLEPNCTAISVQAGRTVITVSLKRRWRLRIPACIRQNSTDIYVVVRQQQPPLSLFQNDVREASGAEPEDSNAEQLPTRPID